MATGLWNIGGINLPDLGLSEKLGLSKIGIPNNSAVYPSYGKLDSSNNIFNNKPTSSNPTGFSGIKSTNQPTSSQPTGQTSGQVLGTQSSNQPTSGNSKLDIFRSMYGANETMPPGWNPPGYVDTDLTSRIDELYNPIMGELDKQEGFIRGGEQDLYTQATSPYDAQLPILDQAKAQGLNTVEANKSEQQVQEQNALAAARRLYQELKQGNLQRFGGSSSAGEFSNDILGREFQRNMGQVRQTAGSNIQKLLQRANDINDNYNTQLQSITAQKSAALAQAKDVFRQRLSEISNSRIAANENKAQLKLQELQGLRARVQAIQDQFTQYQQNLSLQNQQTANQIVAQIAAYQAQNGQPVNLDAIQKSVFSSFGGGTQQIGAGDISSFYSGPATAKKSPYDL